MRRFRMPESHEGQAFSTDYQAAARIERRTGPARYCSETGDAAMPSKTREQFKRTLERKPDMPKQGDAATLGNPADTTHPPHTPEARQSELPVSRGGMNQESREHNKHNHPTQGGHGPQKH